MFNVDLAKDIVTYTQKFEQEGYTEDNGMGLEVIKWDDGGYTYIFAGEETYAEDAEEIVEFLKEDWDYCMSFSQLHRDYCKENGLCTALFDDIGR